MIIIKSQQEIDIMRESGKVTALILKELEQFVRPGISTAEINRFYNIVSIVILVVYYFQYLSVRKHVAI